MWPRRLGRVAEAEEVERSALAVAAHPLEELGPLRILFESALSRGGAAESTRLLDQREKCLRVLGDPMDNPLLLLERSKLCRLKGQHREAARLAKMAGLNS